MEISDILVDDIYQYDLQCKSHQVSEYALYGLYTIKERNTKFHNTPPQIII